MEFLPGYFFSPDTGTHTAKIFDKGPGEKNLILDVRQAAVYPFTGGWIDLRIGFFLSVTKAAADDDPSSLAEVITHPVGSNDMPRPNRHWIGLKTNNQTFPRTNNITFIGFTNAGQNSHGDDDEDDTNLVSSDSNKGTATNQYWWRSTSLVAGQELHYAFQGWNGVAQRVFGGSGFPHLPQVPASAGGYAALIAFRIRRPDASSTHLIFEIPHPSIWRTDILWTNTPSKTLLTAQLEAWSFPVQVRGPYTFTGSLPDALFAYWPYHNSRLRIHCWGMRAA